MERRTSSYLSTNVKQLLRLAVEPCRDAALNDQALQCLRKEGQVIVFEDQPLLFLLGSVNISDFGARNSQWYKVILRRLSPLFNYAHDLLIREKFNRDISNDPTLTWLTHPRLIYEAITIIQTRDDKCVAHEVLLSLTPMLERSLGNLLYSSNKKLKIPSLLRDLINTQELHQVIGSEILILLLHIMTGTPQGLNLRNLVWHGFPRPGEIHPALASSMIVLIFSVGEALIIQGVERMEPRPNVDLLGQRGMLAKIERIYSSIPLTIDEVGASFVQGIRDDNPKGPLLARVHKLLSKNKFRQALNLLIPEWECQARLLFTLVNSCQSRSLTAEDDKLYTTFDEILSKIRLDPEEDKEVENLFPVTIGDRHMELLMDCLILPEGPRLRDKFSHGEINLDEEITNNILRMCIYIIMASFNDIDQYLSPLTSERVASFNDYHALFHPKRLLVDEIDEVVIELQNVLDHPSLTTSANLTLDPEDPMINLLPRMDSCLGFVTSEHFDSIGEAVRRFCETVQIQTLYRPKYEYVINSLFRRLLMTIRLSLERSMENLDDKMIKHEGNELNSRQLATYGRMLETVPRTCLLFQAWITFIIVNMENFDDRIDLFKVGKKMLKYGENLAHNAHISKNRWDESGAIVTKCAKLILELDFLNRELKSKQLTKPSSAVIQELPKLTEINS